MASRLFITSIFHLTIFSQLEWDTNPGVQEIQTITTSTYTGPNEIQSFTTYAKAIPEIQIVQSFATSVSPEVQMITITGATGGYFFLELDTTAQGGSLQYSGYIYSNYQASGSRESVQQIISEMSNVKPYGSVIVTDSTINSESYEYMVTFPQAMGDVPVMKVPSSSCNIFLVK